VQALNAGIAEVAQAQQELNHRTAYQTQQLQAGQQIYQTSATQAVQASGYKTIDLGLNGLPMGSFRQPVYWGAKP